MNNTDSTIFPAAGAGLRVGYGFVGRNPCKSCSTEASALRSKHGGTVVAGKLRFYRVPQTAAQNRVLATTPSPKGQGAEAPSWSIAVCTRRWISGLRSSEGLPQKLGNFLTDAYARGGDTDSRFIIDAHERSSMDGCSAMRRCSRQTATAAKTRSKVIV